jgi:Transcription factor WhiB
VTGRYGHPRPGAVPALQRPPAELAAGLCVSHPAAHWWSSGHPSERGAASAVCHCCPVSAACLEHALRLPSCGGQMIYAGTTITERQQMRRERRAALS